MIIIPHTGPVPSMNVVSEVWLLLGREPEHFDSYVEEYGLDRVWREDLLPWMEYLYQKNHTLEEHNRQLRRATGQQTDVARRNRNRAVYQRRRAARWQLRAERAEARLREMFGRKCIVDDEGYCEAHGMSYGCLQASHSQRRGVPHA